jgi:hypothetical protein
MEAVIYLLVIGILFAAGGVITWKLLMRDTSSDIAPDWKDGGEPGAGTGPYTPP